MPLPRLVDLPRPLTPGQRGLSTEPNAPFVPHGWNPATWPRTSRAGTPMDPRCHSAAGPETSDTKPLSLGLGPSALVNRTPIAPRRLIPVARLGPVADHFSGGGGILPGTGRHRHAADPATYRDDLPRISDEVAAS